MSYSEEIGEYGSESQEEPKKKEKRGHKKYKKDANIPKNRRVTPVDESEPGLKITYPMLKKASLKKGDDGYDPDFTYKEFCTDLKIDKRSGQRKCMKRIQKAYRKEYAVLYTSECNDIRNPFKRKKCIAKFNRGL